MKRVIIFILFSFCVKFSISAQSHTENLKKEINQFNDEGRYEESILLLDRIVNDPKSTNYEIYQAYFYKSTTYRRLFNYSEAIHNLDLSLKAGQRSSKKKEVEIQVAVERLFIQFDRLEFDEVEKTLSQIKLEDIHFLEVDTRAFFISILGTMEIRKKNFVEAERYLDQAILIFEEHEPRHLPLIYVKKVDLFTQLNDSAKVIKNFETGLAYAKQYGIKTYVITLYDVLSQYYTGIEDYKNASLANRKIAEWGTDYNAANANGELYLFEKKLMKKKADEKLKKERNVRIALIAIALVLIGTVAVLYRYYQRNKKTRLLIEAENDKVRKELEKAMHTLSNLEASIMEIEKAKLTPRQQRIVELVKEGKTNKEIGEEMFISENTVKYHLKTIYTLLNIANRTELR